MRTQSKFTKKVIKFIQSHPNWKPAELAEKFNVSVGRIYQLRKKAQAEAWGSTEDIDKAFGVALQDIPDHPAEIETAKTIEKAKRLYVPRAAIEVAQKLGISPEDYVKQIRKMDPTAFEETNDLTPPEPSKVDTILDQRATQYGKFIEGAEIMQTLKQVVRSALQKRGTALAFDQLESIDMVIHKLGRIINGNPDNVDSWRDIAGYATLVADRLEGNAR